jgi:hypothetical protein
VKKKVQKVQPRAIRLTFVPAFSTQVVSKE